MGRDLTSADAVTSMVTTPGADPLVGQVLDGRFKVVEPIGTGGMGRVYRAVQQPLNRAVALKVLDYNYGAGKDEGFRQRFLVEAAMTAKLSHPNTITVIDYGCTANGIFYIAMEYLDGRTLDQVVTDDGPLPWRRVLHIGQQIARSLREAHKLGVVHRDLKPANVMLLHADDDTDQVKVLDFGLVKSFVVGQELEGRAITQQGMLMGSPPYMAPEQGELNHADPRSDIYSLGTVLYEALTGAPPFTGQSAMEVILKHVNQPVPPMRVPGALDLVPEAMETLVANCLAKSPMDRFQSMDEVLQAMQELATPIAAAPAVTDEVPVLEEPRKSGNALTGVVFVLALMLGAGAATMIIRELRLTVGSARAERHPPVPSDSVASDSVASDAVASDAVPSDAVPSDAVPSDAVPSGAAPSDAVPRGAAPSDAVPSEKPTVASTHSGGAAGSLDSTAGEPEPSGSGRSHPPVTFHVETEPRGAAVTLEGKLVGRTPLELQVPLAASGLARAELGLSLSGYQPTTVSASGETGTVVVKEKLRPAIASRKRPSPPAKKAASAKLDGEDDDRPAPPGPADELKSPLLPKSN
jgi:serine/threonine protein kinase